MSNAVRHGFSTLNRLFGKKNKDGADIKPLPKSTATLSRSTSNLDTSSQHNKIVPLVAASTNAPFEQTFRVTVCLPMDQLYVARVGARTKLSNLLEMVCTNKLLDPSKFEFRHPADETQTYDLEMTVGEVGLNEIRLASKIPMRQKDGWKARPHSTIITNHSQNIPKFQLTDNRLSHRTTTSPYSSTNSLNSTDSSGMNSSLRSGSHHGPVVPCRKKRVAPRPPSQNSIPEDREHKYSAPSSQKSDDDGVFKRPLLRQNFHVSSPNLTNGNGLALRYKEFHCSNNNVCPSNESANGDTSLSSIETNSSGGDGKKTARPLSMQVDRKNSTSYGHYEEIEENHYADSVNSNHSRTSSETSETMKNGNGPEPIPRKLVVASKKKAPAPPPRSLVTSTNGPVATPRNIPEKIVEEQIKEDNISQQSESLEQTEEKTTAKLPKSSPSVTPTKAHPSPNVTKVMLNVDTTPVVARSHSQISDENIDAADKVISNISKTNISTSQSTKTSPIRNVSKTNLNGLPDAEPLYQTIDVAKKKPRSISVVELNVEKENVKNLESCTEAKTKANVNGVDPERVSEELTNIINKAIEINESRIFFESDGNNNVVQTKDRESHQTEINNNYSADTESTPESPLWIYTIPAPPTFADNKAMQPKEDPAEKFVTSSPIEKNQKVNNEPLTGHPIVEKQHFDFQELSDNSLPHSLSTTDTMTTTGTNATDPDSLITSDIEDGYQGNDSDKVAMKNIQNNREQFIEDEFEFLNDHSDEVVNTNGHADRNSRNGIQNGLEKVIIENGKQKTTENYSVHKTTGKIEEVPRKLSNGIQKVADDNRKLSNGDAAKTDVIEELNNILNTNRLDTVIRKPDETDNIDALKRSSLTNFQIGSYTNGNHEKVSTNQPVNTNGHHVEINDSNQSTQAIETKSPVKRSSLTSFGLNTDSEQDSTLKTPKNIIRSKSFHSMQMALEHTSNGQSNLTNGYSRPFAQTPRTSSYISLIATQKFDSKLGIQTDNLKKVTRQRSISELSIADSPSLQSLEVMKSILSNSRKNSLVEQNGHKVVPNGNTIENGDKKSHQDEVDLRSSTFQHQHQHDQMQPKVTESKVAANGVNMRRSEQPTASEAQDEPKKWKYQGPPSINLSTWGERPKSQVIIKSDSDYKFGGISKVTALQKRFSAALEENSLNSGSNNGDMHENDSKSYKLPVVRGVEYKKNVIQDQANGHSVKNENSAELRQRPSYEVSCLVSEKPNSTMTLGRVPASKPAAFNQHSQVFANNHNSLQRNISFNQFTNQSNKFTPVVKGFKTQDIMMNGSHNGAHNGVDHDYTSNGLKHQSLSAVPVKPNSTASVVFTTYDQEKRHIEVERPSFSQYALKKTGLKDKILDTCVMNGHDGANKGQTIVDGKPKIVNGNRNSVPVPPPKPMHQNGFLPQNQQLKTVNSGCPRINSLTQQKNGDSRNELLDSIRGFNRGALRRC